MLSAFTVLCEKYKKFIDRDPQFIQYLDKIGQVGFEHKKIRYVRHSHTTIYFILICHIT